MHIYVCIYITYMYVYTYIIKEQIIKVMKRYPIAFNSFSVSSEEIITNILDHE